MTVEQVGTVESWDPYLERYRAGEWRDRIFHDLVLTDAAKFGDQPTIVDIGCGRGLDGSIPLQQSLASAAGRFLGIEPDEEIPLGNHFTEAYHCLFEDAPLPPASVHIAYSVMVLEHLPEPEAFWAKLHEVLVDGGVFWGLTVDARHPFCKASLWAEHLKIKPLYLWLIKGERGKDRYENYPVHYKANTPEALRHQARKFSDIETINFSREGQWSCYFPRPLRPLVDRLDRRSISAGLPGTLLMVRAKK